MASVSQLEHKGLSPAWITNSDRLRPIPGAQEDRNRLARGSSHWLRCLHLTHVANRGGRIGQTGGGGKCDAEAARGRSLALHGTLRCRHHSRLLVVSQRHFSLECSRGDPLEPWRADISEPGGDSLVGRSCGNAWVFHSHIWGIKCDSALDPARWEHGGRCRSDKQSLTGSDHCAVRGLRQQRRNTLGP
jgi:hypothetical protein